MNSLHTLFLFCCLFWCTSWSSGQFYSINPNCTTPFENIDNVRQNITLNSGSSNIELPFTFNFGDKDYNHIRVYNSGVLVFLNAANDTVKFNGANNIPTNNSPLPLSIVDNNNIALSTLFPFWDEVQSNNMSGNASMYRAIKGTAPYRRFIIEWTSMNLRNCNTCDFKIQVVLYEGSNHFAFAYGNVNNGDITEPSNFGGKATIGYQINNHTAYEYSFDSTSLKKPNTTESYPCLSFSRLQSFNSHTAYGISSTIADSTAERLTLPLNSIAVALDTSSTTPNISDTLQTTFNIPFYDIAYNNFIIEDGVFYFLDANGDRADSLSVFKSYAPFRWDDQQDGIFYKVDTITKAIIVTWKNVIPSIDTTRHNDIPYYNSTTNGYTFQLQLDQTGLIKYLYKDLYADDTALADISYGRHATIAVGNKIIFNNEPAIQLDGNGDYIYILTIAKPNLEVYNAPFCPSEGKTYIKYNTILPSTNIINVNLIHLSSNTSNSFAGFDSVMVSSSGAYRVECVVNPLKTTSLYTEIDTLVEGYVNYEKTLQINGSSKSINITATQPATLGTVPENISCPSIDFTLIANMNNAIRPTYSWDGGITATTQSITSQSRTSYIVNVTESHTGCIMSDTLEINYSNTNALSGIRLEPISLSVDSANLNDLLVNMVPFKYVNRDSQDYYLKFSGDYIDNETGAFYVSNITTPGNHPITIFAIDRNNPTACPHIKDTVIQILPKPAILGLESDYCDRSVSSVTIRRDSPTFKSESRTRGNYNYQFSGARVGEIMVQFSDMKMTAYDGQSTTGIKLNINSSGDYELADNSAQLDLSQFSDSIRVVVEYFSTVKAEREIYTTPFYEYTYLLARAEMWVKKGNHTAEIKYAGVRHNNPQDPLIVCEYDLNNRITVNSSAFDRDDRRGSIKVEYEDPNNLGTWKNHRYDSLPVEGTKEAYFNALRIDSFDTDTKDTATLYKLTYEIQKGGCNAKDSLFIYVPEPLEATFSHYLDSTLPASNTYCNNSDPITLIRPNTAFLGNVNIERSYFIIDGTPIYQDTMMDVLVRYNPFIPIVGQHIITYQITDTFGCVNTHSKTIELKAAPEPQISFLYTGQRTWYCSDQTPDQIRVSINHPNSTSLRSHELIQITPLSTDTFRNLANIMNPNAVHHIANPDLYALNNTPDTLTYIYFAEDNAGCKGGDTATVIVHPKPIITFTDLPSITCQDPNVMFDLNPQPLGTTVMVNAGLGAGVNPVAVNNLNTNNNTALFTLEHLVENQVLTYLSRNLTTGCESTKYDTISIISDNTVFSWLDTLPAYVCNSDTTPIRLRVQRPQLSATTPQPNFTSSSTSTTNPLINPSAYIYTDIVDEISFVPALSSTGLITVTYASYTNSVNGCLRYLKDTIRVHQPAPLSIGIFDNGTIDYVCEYDTALLFIPNFPSVNIPLTPNLVNITSPNANTAIAVRPQTSTRYHFVPNAIDSMYRIGAHIVTADVIDNYGCLIHVQDTIFVKANPKPKIHNLDTTYCEGEPAVNITGIPTNGNWYNYDSIGDNLYALYPLAIPAIAPDTLLDMSNNSYAINRITPGFGGAFSYRPLYRGNDKIIYEVQHANGCDNRDTVNITVYGIPELVIDSLPQAFVCSNGDTLPLSATVDGARNYLGTVMFSETNIPSGVLLDTINQQYLFNSRAIKPSTVLTRTITAIYRSPISGCIDTATLNIEARRHPTADIINIENGYCINGLTSILIGRNEDSINLPPTFPINIIHGQFSSLYAGVITPIDNYSANIDPTRIQNSFDTITYIIQTDNGCSDTIKYHVLSYPVPSNLDINMDGNVFCENSNTIQITGQPIGSASSNTTGLFEIFRGTNATPILSTNNNIVLIDPVAEQATYPIDYYDIKYTYTDQYGCIASITKDFSIHPKPQADFTQITFCADDTIRIEDASFFNQNLDSLDILHQWIWSYRGVTYNTASNNFLEVYNTTSGPASVQLIAISEANCRDTINQNIMIYSNAKVSLKAVGGCQGDTIFFRPSISGLIDTVDNMALDWISSAIIDYDNGITENLTPLAFDSLGHFTYSYNTVGTFYPRLSITNSNHCVTFDEIRLPILPKYTPTVNMPYFEDFNANNGNWIPDFNMHGDMIWEYGIADKRFLKTRPNNNVWITGLTTPFPEDAGSWIYAPCFDITQLDRPMVKFDLATHLNDYEGVVLQYFNDSTERWVNVGFKDKGINWYDVTNLPALLLHDSTQTYDPSSIHGWTGNHGYIDSNYTKFENVRYRLDNLPNSNRLRFRIAFATFPNIVNVGDKEGVMFDNFFIGNRSKKVLVEYIHNSDTSILRSNQHVRGIVYTQEYIKDVAFVQYHLPEDDQIINQSTDFVHNHLLSNRPANINAGTAILNRNTFYNYPHDPAMPLSKNHVDAQMLADAKIKIDNYGLLIDMINQKVSVQGEIIALDDIEIPSTVSLAHYTLLSQNHLDWYVHGINYKHMSVVKDGLIAPTYGYFREEPIAPLGTPVFAAGETYQLSGEFPLDNRWGNLRDIIFNDTANLVATTFIILGPDSLLQVEQFSHLNILSLPEFSGITIGVDELNNIHQQGKEIFSLKLYPNPAINYTVLAFDQPLKHDYQYALYDIQGRMLQQGHIPQNSSELEINTEQLMSGTYIIKVNDQFGTVHATRKLIVIKP